MNLHAETERKTTSSSREALRRKIERTIKSIDQVSKQLYTEEGPSDARLECLAIDTERLADFCRFVCSGGKA